ncbi:hypothetical protein [Nocardia sp. NPDC057353]|uniref:hypothetical protein n=1 Tax=Nocardia sp. NPDC057353 TaxID=3346104 RepID=UPI0036424F99
MSRWKRSAPHRGPVAVAATGAVLALVVAPALALTAGESAASAPAEDAGVAAAVLALSTDDIGVAVPQGFAEQFGYHPELLDGLVVRPDGGCSSPVTLPVEFELPCKGHDLGYDLLRFADARGAALGPWARRDLDAALAGHMHRACEVRADEFSRTRCHFMADVASAAVTANSHRQDYGVPVVEEVTVPDPEGNNAGMLAGAGVLATGAVALRFSRRGRGRGVPALAPPDAPARADVPAHAEAARPGTAQPGTARPDSVRPDDTARLDGAAQR